MPTPNHPGSILVQSRAEDAQRLQKMHSRDTLFLKSCNVMDYSILVGVAPVEGSDSSVPQTAWKSQDGKELYFLGIIDFLVEFGLKMRAYHLVPMMEEKNRPPIVFMSIHDFP